MPSTTRYRRGDIVLVPFPFTDLSSSKKHPALVVSPNAFNDQMQDVVRARMTATGSAAQQREALVSRCLDSNGTTCHAEHMTQAAKKLLDEFEILPDQDRAEVIAEILRRTALAPHDLPKDEDLVAAADSVFLDLDRRESS